MKVYESHLEFLLNRLGWSKQYFADKVGVDVRTLQRWCKDMKGTGYNPCVSYLELCCRVLGV